jgi:hypothetical protein
MTCFPVTTGTYQYVDATLPAKVVVLQFLLSLFHPGLWNRDEKSVLCCPIPDPATGASGKWAFVTHEGTGGKVRTTQLRSLPKEMPRDKFRATPILTRIINVVCCSALRRIDKSAPRSRFPGTCLEKSAPAPEIHGSHATSSVPETGVTTMAKKTGDPLRHQ